MKIAKVIVTRSLAGGLLRALALLCGLFSSVLIARSIGPDKLGISTFAMVAAAQLSLLITSNQEPSLIRRMADDSLKHQAAGDEFVSGIFFLRSFVFCLIAIIGLFIGITYGYKIVTIGAIFYGFALSNPPLWLYQSKEILGRQLWFNAIQQVLTLLGVIAFVRKDITVGLDLLIVGLCSALITSLSWIYIIRVMGIRLSLSIDGLRRAVSSYKGGGWLFLSGLAIFAYTRLEQPLIGLLADIEALGRYRTAFQVSSAVASITGLVPMYLYPQLLTWSKQGSEHLWRMQKRTAILSVYIILVVSLFVCPSILLLYPVVFGPSYNLAAWPAIVLVLSQFIVVVSGIFAWGLWAAGRDRQVCIIYVMAAIFSIVTNILFIPKFGIMGAAVVNLCSETLVLGCGIYLSFLRKK